MSDWSERSVHQTCAIKLIGVIGVSEQRLVSLSIWQLHALTNGLGTFRLQSPLHGLQLVIRSLKTVTDWSNIERKRQQTANQVT